jgi:sugar/nucleoside kinase (ribokinase family)
METDTTGCGDTYMAGYLYQRIKRATPENAVQFGAALATLKIELPVRLPVLRQMCQRY